MKTNVNSSLTVHPQAAHFRNQNRRLQSEIARLIVERDDLKFLIVPNIEAEYRSKIGALEWRVFQMDCETRAILRRIEMAQAMLNRGDEPCFRCIEQEIETEFAAWREQIEHQAREIKAAKERENLPRLSRAESRELQTLYRKLAFLLHPDILKNADERRQNCGCKHRKPIAAAICKLCGRFVCWSKRIRKISICRTKIFWKV